MAQPHPTSATTASGASAPDGPILRVEALGHRYGERVALDRVSFAVRRGQVTMLLGPNGAGKTTLFALLTRLIPVQTGHIALEGRDLTRMPATALSAMGVVFQQPTLDLDVSVMGNMTYSADLHGLPRAAARARIDTELARIGLADRARDKVRSLNGGHRRRVEIARALIHDPRLLILDEPTVGLDMPTRDALVAVLHDLAAGKGLAVLWTTHLIDEIRPDDALVVLSRGRVVAQGTPATVIAAAGAADLPEAFGRLTRPTGGGAGGKAGAAA